MTQYYNNT